jgi:Concanavalin A-like lectin/glucanases superfamily
MKFNPELFFKQGKYYLLKNNMKFNLDPANSVSYAGSGTTVNDISGNAQNGTLVNTVTYSTSNSGIFTMGTNGIIGLGNILNTELVAGKFTISGWFKLTSSTANYNNFLFSKYSGSPATDNRVFFTVFRNLTASSYGGIKAEIVYYGALVGGSYRQIRGNTTIATNTWYHVVFTFDKDITTNDGLDKVQIYLNGVAETKTLVSSVGSQPTSLPSGSAAPFCIGNSTNPSYANPYSIFQGSIGECSFYNRVLTANEVVVIYNTLKYRYP